MGFCHLLEMKCTKCNFYKNFRTSLKSKNSLNTNKFPTDTIKKELSSLESPYEINLRAVIGLQEIGAGHESMKTFSFCMNLYCLSPNDFNKLNKTAMLVYKIAAEESMQKAAFETKSINNSLEMEEVRISIDGSWQK